ncbi:MAG TPA: A24 family peptidase [Phycisphaerae bacterium]|nr:A24 family peptidase [Phycisphaerae bacterium]
MIDGPASTVDQPPQPAPSPAPPHANIGAPATWLTTWTLLLCAAALLALLQTRASHGLAGNFVGMLTLLICALAALFDAWTARIPNRLTYTAILAGLALNALAGASTHFPAHSAHLLQRWLSAAGPAESLLGFALCAAAGLAAFIVARVGGGDVKLLAAVGALLGITQTVEVLVAALSAAVLYALLNLLIAGRLNLAVRLAACRLLELLYLRKLHLPDEETAKALSVPMAVPLALGVAIAQFLQLRTLASGGIHP